MIIAPAPFQRLFQYAFGKHPIPRRCPTAAALAAVAALTALGVATPGGSAAAPLDLRFRFRPGRVTLLRMEFSGSLAPVKAAPGDAAAGPGVELELVTEQEWRVIAVWPEGNGTVQLTPRSVMSRLDVGLVRIVLRASDGKASALINGQPVPLGEVAPGFDASALQPLTVRISPRGEVLEVKGPPGTTLGPPAGAVPLLFPERAVEPGGRWPASGSLPLPALEPGRTLVAELKGSNLLRSVRDEGGHRIATVETTARAARKDPPRFSQDLQVVSEFDLDAGELLRSVGSGELEMDAPAGSAAPLRGTLESRLEARPAAPAGP